MTAHTITRIGRDENRARPTAWQRDRANPFVDDFRNRRAPWWVRMLAGGGR